MATIRKRGNAYQIRVGSGYDMKGNQIVRAYTYTPPLGLTPRQVEKEVEKQMVLFEKKVKDGQYIDGKMTFSDFSQRWIKDYAENQLAPKTLQRYKSLLIRINEAIGYIKLEKLQPQHLVAFYGNLGEEGISNRGTFTANPGLIDMLKKDITKIAQITGISDRTIKGIVKGRATNKITANKLLEALGVKDQSMFTSTSGITSLSPITIQHHHCLISSILSTAVQWQVILSNPCERVKPPKVDHKEAKYLDDVQAREVIELLSNADIKYRTAITLLIYSGLRRGELCGLEWSDIDFKNETISIKRASQYLPEKGIFEKTTKNKSSLRTIILPSNIFSLLSEYRNYQKIQRVKCGDIWIDSNRLFIQWNGTPMHPDTLTTWFHKWIKKNNLPDVSIHSLRHTSATLLISAGIPISAVSGRLGHAQTSTTSNIYTHVMKSAAAAASETMGDILNPKNNNSKHA